MWSIQGCISGQLETLLPFSERWRKSVFFNFELSAYTNSNGNLKHYVETT